MTLNEMWGKSENSNLQSFFEVTLMFLLGQGIFWNVEQLPSHSVYFLILMMILSFIYHKDSPRSLGLQIKNFSSCFFHYQGWGLFFLILLFLDVLTGHIESILQLMTSAEYFYSVALQQLFFSSYLIHRISQLVDTTKTTLIGSLIFASFHLPNLPLTFLGLIAGYCFTVLFLRYRNLWAIILFHYFISIMINVDMLPILESYIPLDNVWNMRVGMSYWK